ncbi:MAG TPA: lamin tail domain-containing protein, partial [Candidatus Paceibacterota bacterium]|nr:lamin tail domain-containing protein [Candidatus Paceibacterota bacterium]
MTRWFLTFLMLLVPTIMHAAVYISEIAWPRPDTISRCVSGLGKVGTALAILLLPHHSNAAVYFSEIAWMGTSNSANDEWIELHNSGSTAVDLSGWRLTDNLNFDITLEGAGSVAPGAFAVLERTDDTSAPGTAFFIYTGSLANTGATLRLYDAIGALIDQVAGGENWEDLGGDNTTKETAQYTSGGWVTAAPTPGA